MIYPDSLTSRVPATAASGLASEAVLQIAAPFSSVSDTKMHRAFKVHQSADRSAEMNGYTNEGKRKTGQRRKNLDSCQPSHRSHCGKNSRDIPTLEL